ncbi:MAG: FecR domain-containing protein [Polyangiaceae bacterium]|nr:FecR domain-containing protein [Polyangiaceae bacterium]
MKTPKGQSWEGVRKARSEELGRAAGDPTSAQNLRALETVLDRVAEFEATPVPEAKQLAEVRAALAEARPSGIRVSRGYRPLAWAGGAFALAAAGAFLVFLLRDSAQVAETGEGFARVMSGQVSSGGRAVAGVVLPGNELEVGGEVPAELELQDGSRVTAEPGSRLSSGGRTLQLVAGKVALSVRHLKGGEGFSVWTKEAQIRVVGTHFTVRREANWSSVKVSEGVVEVLPRAGGVKVTLRAGDGWSSAGASQPPKAVLSAPAASSTGAPPHGSEAPSTPTPGVANEPQSKATEVLSAPKTPDVRVKAGEALRSAEDLVAQGRFSEGIRRYQEVASQYPGTSQAEMARFAAASLAVQHSSQENARQLLNRYLSLHPHGSFAPQAQKLLLRLSEERKP